MGRHLALLGGSAAAAGAALAFQWVRLRLESEGAAVHGVAFLVTLIVFLILLRLVRLQLSGPGLEAPSWERHAHRASLREAPLVAFAGVGVTAFMIVATPGLIVEERSMASPAIAVRASDPDPSASGIPAAKANDMVAAVKIGYVQKSPATGRSTFDDREPSLAKVPFEVNYQWSVPQQEDPQDPLQEPVDPTRQGPDSILRVRPDEPRLPPIQFGLGVLLAVAKGSVDLGADSGRFRLDLDAVRGDQTFEPGVDLAAEFALTSDSAIKVLYAGMAFFEKGTIKGDGTFGGVTVSAGDEYEFEMKWSHLYVALSKRLAGDAKDSPFDFSLHAGAVIDHTLTEFKSEASGLDAESEDGERGWVALGAGFTLTVRGAGPAGLVLEMVQSAPMNIGGQAIALTDARAGLTLEITRDISFYGGYRYVRAEYRLYDSPLVGHGGETTADLAIRGPMFGLDFRF
jgi:hypothetical protein